MKIRDGINIGPTIAEFRKRKGLKQWQLATLVGVSGTSISQIETGATYPKKTTLEKICIYIGVTPEMLFVFSLSKDNVVPGKEQLYESMYPQIREMLIQIFYNNN